MTNGDKIRQMSDDELARKIILGNIPICADNCPNYVLCGTAECEKRIKDWLKQEVKDA